MEMVEIVEMVEMVEKSEFGVRATRLFTFGFPPFSATRLPSSFDHQLIVLFCKLQQLLTLKLREQPFFFSSPTPVPRRATCTRGRVQSVCNNHHHAPPI